MKQNKLAQLSLEELSQKEASLKKSMAVFGGILMILFLACLSLSFFREASLIMLLPVVLFPIYSLGMEQLKKIRAEIATRKPE